MKYEIIRIVSASCSLPDLFKTPQQYCNSYITNLVVICRINLEIIVLNELFIDVIDLLFILSNIIMLYGTEFKQALININHLKLNGTQCY